MPTFASTNESGRLNRNLVAEVGLASTAVIVTAAALAVSFPDCFASVVALACASSGVMVVRIRRGIRIERIGSLLFAVGVVAWYGYPALLGFLWPSLAQVPWDTEGSTEHAHYAAFLVSLFLLSGVLGGAVGDAGKVLRRAVPRVSVPRFWIITSAALVAGLLPFAMAGAAIAEVLIAIAASRTIEKPWRYDGQLGNETSALLVLANSALCAAGAMLWLGAVNTGFSRRLRVACAVLAAGVSGVLFLDSGTRSIVALTVGPASIVWLARRGASLRRFDVARVLLAVAAVMVLLQLQLALREGVALGEGMSSGLLDGIWTLSGTIDFFSETVFATRLIPAAHDYFHESVIVQFLVGPVPRFLWPSKPVPELVWYYSLQRWGVDIYDVSGNVLPGVVGQYYMSWGPAGVVAAGASLGWLSARIDARLRPERHSDAIASGVAVMLALWVFLSFRYVSPGFLYPVLVAAAISVLSRARLVAGRVQCI